MEFVKDLINEIKNKLIRKDGRLNVAAFKTYPNIINTVRNITSYLPKSAPFSRRWWHIQHGKSPPKCSGCNNSTTWNKNGLRYNKYCTQKCASTSQEARERTSKQWKGIKLSKERCKQMSERRKGQKHSEQTKQILREQKLGKRNPQYGKPSWNKGLIGPANPQYGIKKPGTGIKGNKNWMFGNSPPPGTGKGISGKFNSLHFRSSLEMMYLIYLFEHNIRVESAECRKFRVKYIDKNKDEHHYSPDYFLVDKNLVIEIKPRKFYPMALLKINAFRSQNPSLPIVLISELEIGNFIYDTIVARKIERK